MLSDWVTNMIDPIKTSRGYQRLCRWVFHRLRPRSDRALRVRGHVIHYSTFDRFLALTLWKTPFFEHFEYEFVTGMIRPGMTVVDVGANLGLYALAMARQVGAQGRVFAFEPEPNNYRLLEKNIRANGYENITALPQGVADRPGTSRLYLCDFHQGDHRLVDADQNRPSVDIEVTSLDAFFRDRNPAVDLVKIDAQGSEFRILQGMRECVRRNPEIRIICEFDPFLLGQSGVTPAGFEDLIESMGLRIQVINERARRLDGVRLPAMVEGQRHFAWTNLFLSRKS